MAAARKTFEEMVAAVQAFHTKHKFKGTPNENLSHRMALHIEELGELSAAITKGLGKDAVAEELADNLILVVGDAISSDINLEQAFFAKIQRIMQRPAKVVGDTIRVTESVDLKGEERTEIRQLQARLEQVTHDLAKPPKGKQDREHLKDLRADTEAHIAHLKKRLGGRA